MGTGCSIIIILLIIIENLCHTRDAESHGDAVDENGTWTTRSTTHKSLNRNYYLTNTFPHDIYVQEKIHTICKSIPVHSVEDDGIASSIHTDHLCISLSIYSKARHTLVTIIHFCLFQSLIDRLYIIFQFVSLKHYCTALAAGSGSHYL